MKKFIRNIVPIIYLGITLYCITLIVNPGSSVYYFRYTLRRDEIIPHRGDSYRYLLRVNRLISPSEGVFLVEDNRMLSKTSAINVNQKGSGTFSLGDPTDDKYYLRFSATDNSDPRTNGRRYILYQPILFLTRSLLQFYLSVLLLGIAWFGVFVLKSREQRQTIKDSYAMFLQVIDAFINREVAGVYSTVAKPLPLLQSKQVLWKSLYTLTIAAAYFYVFMEWLFFVTKPSFMDLMGWAEKSETLLLSGLAVALIGGALLLVCRGGDFLLSQVRFITLPVFIFIATLIPTVIISATCLLMVDNFTYTVLKFGIVSTEGGWRGAYGLGFLILLVYIYNKVLEFLGLRGEPKTQSTALRTPFLAVTSLLVISSALALVRLGIGYVNNDRPADTQRSSSRSGEMPNILLIGGDGLNAANLSAYGYERDTTPTIRDLAPHSLLAENVFSNSRHSAGSVISIFTSKSPAKTRVLYPPDILKDSDAYQHLPGILRKLGYHTVEIGVTHYVDAFNMNLLDGFDIVNQSSFEEGRVVRFARRLGYSESIYFVSRSIERVADRILHIFFIKEMENPYTIVTQSITKQNDRKRLAALEGLIRDTDQPLFVHVHMMETHGPKFFMEQQVYSKGEKQNRYWMRDFYDDGILNFDRYINELLKTLNETGKSDNTILIIYTDHAMTGDNRVRIPLLIHFPGNEYAGRIQNNVQNLDIAPTILDYLGIPQPKWMEGQSLLQGDPPVHRLIFSAGTLFFTGVGDGIAVIDPERIKPPFYQFMVIDVFDCNNWYELDLLKFELTSGNVAGHTTPCPKGSMLTRDQAKAKILEHLSNNGFDITDLP